MYSSPLYPCSRGTQSQDTRWNGCTSGVSRTLALEMILVAFVSIHVSQIKGLGVNAGTPSTDWYRCAKLLVPGCPRRECHRTDRYSSVLFSTANEAPLACPQREQPC